MVTPHTVSIINLDHSTPRLTVLHGVMLQALNGQSVQRGGAMDEANAVLYVPVTVRAVNAAGESVTFLPPLEYARCPDPEKHWTLQPEGESAGRCSFFVKGVLPQACSLADAREKYDSVYVVAGWQLHDYGSYALRHYEVVSRVSSHYYQYGN